MNTNNLDFFFSTPDEHFNVNAHLWHFSFEAETKGKTIKPIGTFLWALHDIYFYILDNHEKPLTCIDKVKEVMIVHGLDDSEKMILTMKLLGLLMHHPEWNLMQMVWIQLVDLRNDIAPWIEDQEVLSFKPEFIFDEIKDTIARIEDPFRKAQAWREKIFDFKEQFLQMEEYEQRYYLDGNFLPLCENELARVLGNTGLPRISGRNSGGSRSTLSEIALYYHYKGFQITRENQAELAKPFGHHQAKFLYQQYTTFLQPSNRRNDRGTDKLNKNHLRLLNKVIGMLSDDPQSQQEAIDDRNTFLNKTKLDIPDIL